MLETAKISSPFLIHSEKNRLFIQSKKISLSYEETLRLCLKIKSFLREKSLKEGDVLSSFLDEPFHNVLLFLYCLESGVIFNPINPKSPTEFRKKLLSLVKPKFVFEEKKEIDCILKTDHKINLSSDAQKKWLLDKPSLVIFSSGTSSFPKAVVLSLRNLYASALSSKKIIRLSENDAWGLTLPLFHISGVSVVTRSFFSGASIALEEETPTSVVSWVPTQLKRHLDALESPPETKQTVKTVLLGGAPCPNHLLKRALERGIKIYYSYGMTEMSSQIYTQELFLEKGEIKTIGQILEGVELKISKEKEIFVKGPMLFSGYLNEKGKIEKKLDEEGFFGTKDLGIFEGKNLKIIGRKDNQFVSGGENIQPEVVEAALLRLLPHCKNIVVVEKKDEEYGFVPVAFLDQVPDDVQTLKEALRKILPPFMIPKEFFSIPQKTLSEGLKISRQALRNLL